MSHSAPVLLRCPGWIAGQPCGRLASYFSIHSSPRLCIDCARAVLSTYLTKHP